MFIIKNEKLKNGWNQPIGLDWGCGLFKHGGYYGVDIQDHDCVDIVCDINSIDEFKNESVNKILSIHFIEHNAFESVLIYLSLWKRILTPDGFIKLIFPDLLKVTRETDPIRSMNYAYGEGKDKYDHHKSFWCQDSMRFMLNQVGFSRIEVMSLKQLQMFCPIERARWSTGLILRG